MHSIAIIHSAIWYIPLYIDSCLCASVHLFTVAACTATVNAAEGDACSPRAVYGQMQALVSLLTFQGIFVKCCETQTSKYRLYELLLRVSMKLHMRRQDARESHNNSNAE
eukprot:IDg20923t1